MIELHTIKGLELTEDGKVQIHVGHNPKTGLAAEVLTVDECMESVLCCLQNVAWIRYEHNEWRKGKGSGIAWQDFPPELWMRLQDEAKEKEHSSGYWERKYDEQHAKFLDCQKEAETLRNKNYWLQSEHESECEKSYFDGVQEGQKQTREYVTSEAFKLMTTEYAAYIPGEIAEEIRDKLSPKEETE